jgi:hypothetical protein
MVIIMFINSNLADTHPVAVVIYHIAYGQTVKVDCCRFGWGGLHGKDVVGTGKGKMGTIPAFCVGRAAWEGCTGNWERKNRNHPSICSREGYMGRK